MVSRHRQYVNHGCGCTALTFYLQKQVVGWPTLVCQTLVSLRETCQIKAHNASSCYSGDVKRRGGNRRGWGISRGLPRRANPGVETRGVQRASCRLSLKFRLFTFFAILNSGPTLM